MANKVAKMPPAKKSPGHPFDKWLDGNCWHIKKGEDFIGNMASMRVQVYRAAAIRGIAVTLRVDDSETGYYVQADRKNKPNKKPTK